MESLPWISSRTIPIEVNCFETEAILNRVSGVFGIRYSRLARPYALEKMILAPFIIPTTPPGWFGWFQEINRLSIFFIEPE